jgi:hypothetical protein
VHERNRSLVLRTTRKWTDAGRRFTQHDVAMAFGFSVSCVRLFWDFVEGRAFVLQPSRAAKFEETRDAMRRAVALIRHSGAPLTILASVGCSGLPSARSNATQSLSEWLTENGKADLSHKGRLLIDVNNGAGDDCHQRQYVSKLLIIGKRNDGFCDRYKVLDI